MSDKVEIKPNPIEQVRKEIYTENYHLLCDYDIERLKIYLDVIGIIRYSYRQREYLDELEELIIHVLSQKQDKNKNEVSRM